MRKGVELKSWKDLEGKKIGRPPGTYAGILFTLAAEANNVDLSKVNIVNTTPAGAPELAALKNGDLDGFVLWSPIIDRTVIEGYGYYPACCDIGATQEFGAGNQLLAANAEFLKDRKLVVSFLKAYVEGMDYYSKNPDKTRCAGGAIYRRQPSRFSARRSPIPAGPIASISRTRSMSPSKAPNSVSPKRHERQGAGLFRSELSCGSHRTTSRSARQLWTLGCWVGSRRDRMPDSLTAAGSQSRAGLRQVWRVGAAAMGAHRAAGAAPGIAAGTVAICLDRGLVRSELRSFADHGARLMVAMDIRPALGSRLVFRHLARIRLSQRLARVC